MIMAHGPSPIAQYADWAVCLLIDRLAFFPISSLSTSPNVVGPACKDCRDGPTHKPWALLWLLAGPFHKAVRLSLSDYRRLIRGLFLLIGFAWTFVRDRKCWYPLCQVGCSTF
jgi:hypothetical protein